MARVSVLLTSRAPWAIYESPALGRWARGTSRDLDESMARRLIEMYGDAFRVEGAREVARQTGAMPRQAIVRRAG